jgi:outer membrane protein assembly factor BamB
MRRVLVLSFCGVVALSSALSANWPSWRGPTSDGVSPETNLPVKWSPTETSHGRWPYRRSGTPIICDTIFLNVAEADPTRCRCGPESPHRPGPLEAASERGNNKQRKQNMSSPSPVTDGAIVWATTGTGFIRAFDFAGKELWMRDIQKDYGRFGLNWGYANSPLLLEGDLIVPVLHGMKTDDPSYILRIDGKTGRTKWWVERPNKAIRESPDAYTTPALVRLANASEIVITGADVVTGHDPATGRELWRADGLNLQNDLSYRIVASPVVHKDVVIAPTRERPLLALAPAAAATSPLASALGVQPAQTFPRPSPTGRGST